MIYNKTIFSFPIYNNNNQIKELFGKIKIIR